jgi:hypothetical protein
LDGALSASAYGVASLQQNVETFFKLASSWWLVKTEAPMFIINGTSKGRSAESCCFIFESITMARVIADKLEDQGLEVEILDQDGELIIQDPVDPYRRLLGAHL